MDEFRATHRHRKGGLYELIGYGRHTETDEAVAVYRSADGILWVRPAVMFDDGRFVPVVEEPEETEDRWARHYDGCLPG